MLNKFARCMLLAGCILLTGCRANQAIHLRCSTLFASHGDSTQEALSVKSDMPIWRQMKLLTDKEGNIYLLQKDKNQILKFSSLGDLSNVIQPLDSQGETFEDFGVSSDGTIYTAMSATVVVPFSGKEQTSRVYAAIYKFDSDGKFQEKWADWRDADWVQEGIVNGLSAQNPFQYLVVDSEGTVFSTWGVTGRVSQYLSQDEERVIYDGGIKLRNRIMGQDNVLYVVEGAVGNDDQLLAYDPHDGALVKQTSFDTFDVVKQGIELGLLRAVDTDSNLYFGGGGAELEGAHRLIALSKMVS